MAATQLPVITLCATLEVKLSCQIIRVTFSCVACDNAPDCHWQFVLAVSLVCRGWLNFDEQKQLQTNRNDVNCSTYRAKWWPISPNNSLPSVRPTFEKWSNNFMFDWTGFDYIFDGWLRILRRFYGPRVWFLAHRQRSMLFALTQRKAWDFVKHRVAIFGMLAQPFAQSLSSICAWARKSITE